MSAASCTAAYIAQKWSGIVNAFPVGLRIANAFVAYATYRLGVLVPVIGFDQVGGQAMADRYTYIPLIGIFVMVAWGVPEIPGNFRFRRYVPAFAGGAALIGLAVAARFQTAHWRGSGPLFEHALKVTSRNWLAHYCLGAEFAASGRLDEAIPH